MTILRHTTIRQTALSGAAAIALMTSAAYGQAAEAATEPAFQAQVDLSIPAQTLDGALTAFADQTGLMLLYAPEVVDGLSAPAIDGAMAPLAALDSLLANSGVGYVLTDSNAILLGDPRVISGASSQAAAMSAPNAPVAVASATQAAQPMGPTGEAGEPGIVRGVVRAAEANAGLDGALITIEETGQTTSTDDLGRFRFANVPAGRYTVTVSYLGFAESSQVVDLEAGGDVTLPFQLASALDVIVVRGSRSARAQALNQERTADNISTVLSSDFLGQFDGTTISEALRRAPGIAFEQDEVTGDGTNIIVRGLSPDLNTVTLNGLRLPEGSGTGRSADLSNILTESIAEITINKTLLPSQDSSGTGGLIEIVTKGPLDRDRRFANFSIQGSQRDKDFYEDYLASGTVSGIFGVDDNFGLSLSVQYREQDIRRLSYDAPVNIPFVLPLYLPLANNGTPLTSPIFIDPRTAFPFEQGVDDLYVTQVSTSANGADSTNLSFTISGQWQIADHTELRFDYTRADEERDSFTQAIRVSAPAAYQALPVSQLGGEVRGALVWQGALPFAPDTGVANARRVTSIDDGRKDITNTFSFSGQTEVGAWEFDYNFGHAEAKIETPFAGNVSTRTQFDFSASDFASEEARQNLTSDGRIVSAFSPLRGDAFPTLLFNQAGFDFYNDPDAINFGGGSYLDGQGGSNERTTINLSARYNVKRGPVNYLEIGAFSETARFEDARLGDGQILGVGASSQLPVPLSSFGIGLVDNGFSEIGLRNQFLVIGQEEARSLIARLPSIADGDPDFRVGFNVFSDPRLRDAFTEEVNFSAYLQAGAEFGKLDVVGGVRLDNVEVTARNLISPSLVDEFGNTDLLFSEQNSRLVDQEGSQTVILPRVALTYRQNDNLLVRAGYSVSVARPQIQNLSDDSTARLTLLRTQGPNLNQPELAVSSGNPDLEPARTENFDLGVERYFDDVGQIKFGLFYKRIENALELNTLGGVDSLEGIVLPDDPRFQNLPDDIFISVTTPVNADDISEIWGYEAVIERQLSFLPGFWSGFGVFANYTYTDSSKTQPFSFFEFNTLEQINVEVEDVPFDGAPEHSGTVAVTYNQYGIDASLSYTRQARRLRAYQAFNLSLFDEEDDSLDFRAEYRFDRFGANWRVWAVGSDLLKGVEDADVQRSVGGTGGTPSYFVGANYFGGRTLSLGLAASF